MCVWGEGGVGFGPNGEAAMVLGPSVVNRQTGEMFKVLV